jgi:hypothetical protein
MSPWRSEPCPTDEVAGSTQPCIRKSWLPPLPHPLAAKVPFQAPPRRQDQAHGGHPSWQKRTGQELERENPSAGRCSARLHPASPFCTRAGRRDFGSSIAKAAATTIPAPNTVKGTAVPCVFSLSKPKIAFPA